MSLFNSVKQRDKFVCQCCKRPNRLTVHHIVPVSNGGWNAKGNLLTVCEGCHRQIHKISLTSNMFQDIQRNRVARILVLREMLPGEWNSAEYTSPLSQVLSEFSRLPEISSESWKEMSGEK